MTGLQVLSPGPRTTIQDRGRRGYQRHGLAQGGAADLLAFLWANKLLENTDHSACLEITLGGFEAIAEGSMTLAITGAATDITVNGRPVAPWSTVHLNNGDRLKVGLHRHGRYSYLAMPGGIDAPTFCGSRSVVLREKIPGFTALSEADRTRPLRPDTATPHRTVPRHKQPDYAGEVMLRIVPGYQIAQFQPDDLHRLTARDYQVSQQSDRMGARMEGKPLQQVPEGVISEGIAMGAIQVPGDGLPIVLLNDRQTIGGYPKIGTLGAIDCSRLAQRLPGQTVRFGFADLQDIQCERLLMERYFKRTRWCDTGTDLYWE